eukprot:273066_1
MSDKVKGTALPSFLSNIRNAGRASAATSGPMGMGNRKASVNEMRPLMMELETDLESSSNDTRRSQSQSQSQYNKRLNNLTATSQNFSRFVKDKLKKGSARGRRRRNRDQGFAVQLPPKVLVYTIVIFFVLPLLMGSIFVVRAVFFGDLKEDEMHPLHKKAKLSHVPVVKHDDNDNPTDIANIENIVNATTMMEGDIISDHAVQASNPLLDISNANANDNGIVENTFSMNTVEEEYEDTTNSNIQNSMDTAGIGSDENVHFTPDVRRDPINPDDMTPRDMNLGSDTEELMKENPFLPDNVASSDIGDGKEREEEMDGYHTSDTQQQQQDDISIPKDSQFSSGMETAGVGNSAPDISTGSSNTTQPLQ